MEEERNAITQIFCENVRNLCKERGIDIRVLENELGLPRGYFSEVRARRRKSTPGTVLIGATMFFNVSADSLVERGFCK